MTDTRLTQIAVEQWGVGTPAVQLTQVAAEHWASVATVTVRTVMTQIAVEHWASVAAAGAGGAPAMAMVLA